MSFSLKRWRAQSPKRKNDAGAKPLELIGLLKSSPETRGINLIGFVSHVQADLIQSAREKGCDTVMARSAFSQNLPALLQALNV
jgi:hypothetical protein